ncbi:MAG: sulfatase [Firmicutes bacterium]|nr:sulfatase [Bacillota bacterium]
MHHKRPNILFIMSDDHSANAISAYGSRLAPVFKTPNIDRIALEGAKLNACFCTNAICTPSRASIMTGQHSHVNGVKTHHDILHSSKNTFVKMLHKSGYQTAIVGKWHLFSEPKHFDYYDILTNQGRYFDPYFLDKDHDWHDIRSIHENEYGKRHEGYVTDIITEKSVNFLKTRDKNKPFLLMCHHKAPHDDFEYHPRYEHMFDDVLIPEPDSLWEDKSHRSMASRGYGTTVSEKNSARNAVETMSRPDYPTGSLKVEGLSSDERTRAAYQKYLKDYLRTVKGIDDSVGELLGVLENEGVLDDTIVFYTSDQGIFLGEHDYIDKRWIYEEALRMPMLIRYPKEIKAKTEIDNIVSNTDFAPTILDYANLSKTDEMQGCSFRALLKGEKLDNWKDILYYRYWMHMAYHDNPAHFGIRTRDYKLIFFYGLPLDANGALPEATPAGWELYDLKKDPFELKNVYSQPEYKTTIKSLKCELFEIRHELEDEDRNFPELLKRLEQTD